MLLTKACLEASVSNSKNSKVKFEARYLWCLQTNFFCKKSARASPQLVSGRLSLKLSKHVIKMLNAERFCCHSFQQEKITEADHSAHVEGNIKGGTSCSPSGFPQFGLINILQTPFI
ncbi:hypothetical protein CEXT_491221 [Caerostris extrusa]|uniref:Uncharacterized protein n=1 Tax=Caerostris extrusa TaxID=172846 RepID=A0AAV4UGC1_CAEEX|nr:hypothetical protein CEXT_491221 [Caerostris extrusa]